MPKQIKILIYIPTFNRPKGLDKQLSILVPQIVKFKNNTRLIVSDNSSDGDYFTKITKKYSISKNIKFISNYGNVGGNANIAFGFIHCKQDEFLWILSDNDLIKDNSIKYLVDNLDSKIDFVVMNYQYDIPTISNHFWIKGWQDPIDWRMGLISDTLFNSNTIKQSIKEAFFYHNSSFPHLAVAISSAKIKQKVNFLHIPRDIIHAEQMSQENNLTDYKIGQVGMPNLLTLLPKKFAKKFAINWIRNHSKDFYLNKKFYKGTHYSSKQLLIEYGGFFVHYYFIKGYMLSLFYPLELVLKKIVKLFIKKNDKN